MALTRAYTDQLEQLGHNQRAYDLYRMRFDPVLTAEELSRTAAGHAPANPTILKAQEGRVSNGRKDSVEGSHVS
jgi:NAD(P)H dehydrogenase (quinone)